MGTVIQRPALPMSNAVVTAGDDTTRRQANGRLGVFQLPPQFRFNPGTTTGTSLDVLLPSPNCPASL